ncbi:MAG: 2,4-dihydroxyhept-2-ene-1,7-dioic acid aldolase [Candidatus Marinimicrobia bacterium]|jgi:2-dehydro-3-deoxyglucarate aldolase|nr:2,4-dihydroxyhept-2-ene-1,7-dioic acid aldolase [Candidatus Neomarinimicrobiota bacterium]MBT7901885.1 2,4-dihydroxyhept-2-ene-1,7-dioic acid aldolase [Candidatus Neomarinimicrobiota bacterium]
MFSRITAVNKIRKKLKENEVSIGSWMQLNSPDVAEIMGQAGFDWVAVDMEHGSISHSDLPNIFRALELGGTLPIARIAEGTLSNCKQALDAGAGGIIAPMIMDAEQLEQIINWCCWPPKGIRGVGYSRANLYGKHFDTYRNEAQAPLIIAQIEHIKAVNNLESILSVGGLDATIIGPYDLSASMGLTGDLEHPGVIKAGKKVIEISNKIGIPSGLHVVAPDKEKLKIATDNGYSFIAYSLDAVFLTDKIDNPY